MTTELSTRSATQSALEAGTRANHTMILVGWIVAAIGWAVHFAYHYYGRGLEVFSGPDLAYHLLPQIGTGIVLVALFAPRDKVGGDKLTVTTLVLGGVLYIIVPVVGAVVLGILPIRSLIVSVRERLGAVRVLASASAMLADVAFVVDSYWHLSNSLERQEDRLGYLQLPLGHQLEIVAFIMGVILAIVGLTTRQKDIDMRRSIT